jgi:ankyrin repeat protein
MTALMIAANNRKWDIVNLLLRRGANATLLNDVCFNFNRKREIYLLQN